MIVQPPQLQRQPRPQPQTAELGAAPSDAPTSVVVLAGGASDLGAAFGATPSGVLGGAPQQISCPMFSGPGYDKRRHPSHTIEVPTLEAPFRSSVAPRRRLETVALSDVRLLEPSAFARAFAVNLQYLKSVDTEALLLTWRLAAGKRWPRGAMRLMGWEHTGSELRGHFLGHWLSASAMSYAATHDADLAETIAKVAAMLEACRSHAHEPQPSHS